MADEDLTVPPRVGDFDPEATPAEIISMLERHYVTAITATGVAIKVGGIAAEIGISLIPGGSAAATGAKAAGKEAGKKAAREVAKATAKGLQRLRRSPLRSVQLSPALSESPRCFPPEISNSSSSSPRFSPSRSPTFTELTTTRSRSVRSSTFCRTAG